MSLYSLSNFQLQQSEESSSEIGFEGAQSQRPMQINLNQRSWSSKDGSGVGPGSGEPVQVPRDSILGDNPFKQQPIQYFAPQKQMSRSDLVRIPYNQETRTSVAQQRDDRTSSMGLSTSVLSI